MILVLLCSSIFVTPFIYNHNRPDDSVIQNDYDTRKEKYDLLKTIAPNCIEEGVQIKFTEIPTDQISYKIYNDKDNIIFNYYIIQENTDATSIRAVITLSSDLYILSEEYSEFVDFENYKHSVLSITFLISLVKVLLFTIVTYIIIFFIIWLILDLRKKFLEKKTDIMS